MYRLAIIAIESGACVANPEYKTEKECYDEFDKFNSFEQQIALSKDVNGRSFIVPNKKGSFVFVVESVE